MAKAFEDLQVLQTAEGIADAVWKQVGEWEYFERDTVGKQLVSSADSIGANISEAFGRYHYGEKLQFLYYARGSVFETKYWLNRVHNRHLMSHEEVQANIERIGQLSRQLNGFLAHIKKQRQRTNRPDQNTFREEPTEYQMAPVYPSALFDEEDLAFLEAQ